MMKPAPAPNKPAANSFLRKLPPAPALKREAAQIAEQHAAQTKTNEPPAPTSKEPPARPLPSAQGVAKPAGGRPLPSTVGKPSGSTTNLITPNTPANGTGNATTNTTSGTNPLSPRGSSRALPAVGGAKTPATQPPTAQPPATQPPATQPPTAQPPAAQPPATQPPSSQPRKVPSAVNIPATFAAQATSPTSQTPVSPRSTPTYTSSNPPPRPPMSTTSPRNTGATSPRAPSPTPPTTSDTTPPTDPKPPVPQRAKSPTKSEPEIPATTTEKDPPATPPTKIEVVTPFVPSKPAASLPKGFTPMSPTATSEFAASTPPRGFAAAMHRTSQPDLAASATASVGAPATVPVSTPPSTPATPTSTPVSIPASTPASAPIAVPASAPVSVPASAPVSVPASAPPTVQPHKLSQPDISPRGMKPVPKRAMSPPPADNDYGIRPKSEARANNTPGKRIDVPESSLPYSFSSSPPSSPARYGSSPSLDTINMIKTSSDGGNENSFLSKLAKTKSFIRPTTALYDPEVMNQTKDQLKDAVRAGLNHMALELLKSHSGLMRRATMQKTNHVQCRLSQDSKYLEFSLLEKPQGLENVKIQEIGRDSLLLSSIESVEPALEARDTAVAAIVSRDKDVDPTCCIAMYLKGKSVGPESPVILVASTRQEYATYYDGLSFVIKGDRGGLQVETEIDVVSEVLAISEIYAATVNSLPISPPPEA